jgi:cytochrome c oxidase assembly protein subunit 15
VFQGVVGWWMVQSGLTGTDVHPVWLAFHLTLAMSTLAVVLTVATSLSTARLESAPRGYRTMAAALIVLAFLQVFYGGLMAGTDAGLTFNTWPAMDSQLVPVRLLLDGFTLGNLVSDIATIQFVHRILAYVLLALTLVHVIQTWRSEFVAPAFAILWAVIGQAVLGILTLLLLVPVPIALLHQFGAMLVVFSTVVHWRAMNAPLPPPSPAGA